MFGIGIVELVVLLLLPAGGLVVAIYLIATARSSAELDEEVARARRHQIGTSVLAGVAAVATVVAGLALGDAVLAVLPSVMVAAACAVLWVGEVTFPRPSGLVRSTVLNPRGLDSVVPPGWLLFCATTAALDLILFVAGALTADGGTSIRFDSGDTSGTASPYPGLPYVAAQLAALTIAALVAWGVCRSAATRPTIATDLDGDAVLRRASGGRVLRWLAWGLVATAAGDLLTAGAAWQSAAPAHLDWPGRIAAVLGIVFLVVALVLPLVPVARLGHRTPRPTVAVR